MKEKKEDKRIPKILWYRARGYSLSAIAQIYKLKSRERIRQIIKTNRRNPKFKKIYKEIDATWKFLNREF